MLAFTPQFSFLADQNSDFTCISYKFCRVCTLPMQLYFSIGIGECHSWNNELLHWLYLSLILHICRVLITCRADNMRPGTQSDNSLQYGTWASSGPALEFTQFGSCVLAKCGNFPCVSVVGGSIRWSSFQPQNWTWGKQHPLSVFHFLTRILFFLSVFKSILSSELE